MTDGPERSDKQMRSSGGDAVASLANEALSVLATRRTSASVHLLTDNVKKLENAVLDRDPDKRAVVLAEFRAQGIQDQDVVEDLIPIVARRLGAAWCEDNMSFADVTIGSARLQALVRDLSPPEPELASSAGGSVAVIVPGDDTHTLGAMVLTSRLRRLGISARIFVGVEDHNVLMAISRSRFDAILVSASHTEKLAMLNNFIAKLKRVTNGTVPVVVGGSIVSRGVAVEKYVDADYITENVEEALGKCGLKISKENHGGRTKPTVTT